jgi:pantoate--beta-alanine ligase
MVTIKVPEVMQTEAEKLRRGGKRIAVVPTMGALHAGHLALIQEARRQADVVVVTVFVNPTQFGPAEDFERYPRDLKRDEDLAAGAGTDILFAPEQELMYTPGYQTYILVEEVSSRLEGAARPGHFRGVASIVAKLLNITKPHVAVFGQKDAQQVAVIRCMLRDLNVDVGLIVVPIVREPDGLAMSSRNAYLTRQQRAEAKILFASLQHAEAMIRNGIRSRETLRDEISSMITAGSSAAIDYVSLANPDTFEELENLADGDTVLISLAARFGATRLIDNILLTV